MQQVETAAQLSALAGLFFATLHLVVVIACGYLALAVVRWLFR